MQRNLFKVVFNIVLLLFAELSFAKDMTNRLGAGFKNNTSVDIPSVSAIYFADKNRAYTAAFGLDTAKNNTTFQANVGLRYIVFFENNLNCYVSGQAGLISVDSSTSGQVSGIEILGLGGVEFFFAGLENLGFSAEAGLGLGTAGSTRIQTKALDPVRAGITFYF
jgi:hypothetical protein